MDLHSSTPYWLMQNGILKPYPSLQENATADVVIMGAGITGALVAYHLVQAGVHVIVVDRRHVGMGSTCASTALLQYEIDTPLSDLMEWVGEKNGLRSYKLCVESIEKLEEITRKMPFSVDFERCKSFYYASKLKDVEGLKKEFELRHKNGFDVSYLEKSSIEKLFPFSAPAAIMSNVAAQVDAYKFAHALLISCINAGAQVHNQTEIKQINYQARHVELVTDKGLLLKAKKLVIASGYESQNYLQQHITRLHSSYAIISEPIPQEKLWYNNCLIWETARPYLYMRTTPDRRILVGGRDEPFYSPNKRDRLINRKSRELAKDFAKKFPHIPFHTDFRWAGTFAETKDGLPYIGETLEHPHTYFALGFGGNGITFSLIAAEIIRDLFKGKPNADATLFAFSRAINK